MIPQNLSSFKIWVEGELIILKPKLNQVSISVAQSYFKVILDERQFRQVLALLFPATIWPHYASHLVEINGKKECWEKNLDPNNQYSWAIPILRFIGDLTLQSNGDLEIDSSVSYNQSTKPFTIGTTGWYYGKLRKDGFRIEVRLKKGNLSPHIQLPLKNPNSKALAILQAFWSPKKRRKKDRDMLEKLFDSIDSI